MLKNYTIIKKQTKKSYNYQNDWSYLNKAVLFLQLFI